jgi:hypothetical protein
MKVLRSPRFITGGLFLLAGVILLMLYLVSGGLMGGMGTGAVCLIAGSCLAGRPKLSVFRNVAGGILLVLFFVLAPTAGSGGVGLALLVMCLLIISAILFSGSLSHVAARPFTGFIDSIYFGNNSRDVPPLTLRLARAYRRDLRFEEALEECERQLEYHPRSADLWFEMIHTARESGDEKSMQACIRKARRRLHPEDCQQLDFEFQRYLSTSEEAPALREGPLTIPLPPLGTPGLFPPPPPPPKMISSREPSKKLRPWNPE